MSVLLTGYATTVKDVFSQRCTNTHGSYKCSCDQGYYLIDVAKNKCEGELVKDLAEKGKPPMYVDIAVSCRIQVMFSE